MAYRDPFLDETLVCASCRKQLTRRRDVFVIWSDGIVFCERCSPTTITGEINKMSTNTCKMCGDFFFGPCNGTNVDGTLCPRCYKAGMSSTERAIAKAEAAKYCETCQAQGPRCSPHCAYNTGTSMNIPPAKDLWDHLQET